MNINTVSTLVSLTLGLLGFLSGLILWYRGSVEKRYAAERDFGHLRRNQEQQSQALAIVDDCLAELSKLSANQLTLLQEIDRRLELIDRQLIQLDTQQYRRRPDPNIQI